LGWKPVSDFRSGLWRQPDEVWEQTRKRATDRAEDEYRDRCPEHRARAEAVGRNEYRQRQ